MMGLIRQIGVKYHIDKQLIPLTSTTHAQAHVTNKYLSISHWTRRTQWVVQTPSFDNSFTTKPGVIN